MIGIMTGHNDILPNDIVDIVLFMRYNSSIETCYGIPVLSAEVELMKYTMTVKEAAGIWHISERRVAYLCKEGRIDGAEKKGRSWEIPADAEKPADNRVRSGIYKKTEPEDKLPLPVGVSNYREAVQSYYYVDKTLLIKDFLDEVPKVSLFTRPRRFGKTLTMEMLRTFFEKSDEDTSVFFRNRNIWKCGRKYREAQGRYPVIYITFKDIKCMTWEATYDLLAEIIKNEFDRHPELGNSSRCNNSEKDYYNRVIGKRTTKEELTTALLTLSSMLHKHHGVPAVIIIDEYDTPVHQGYMTGFYDEVILFMRNLFSGGFKDNPHLAYGFMTGILRIAKESIFSGLNNLKINSILDRKYSSYFGFTSDEVRAMADYYGVPDKYEELRQWYDGYRFGSTDIFNPWSVINYFSNDCTPRTFWQSTGNNDIIGEIMSYADEDIYQRLYSLMQGKSFPAYVDTGVIYPQLKNDPSSIYSFLLVTGYLKALSAETAPDGNFMCEVAVPNKEISFVYNREVLAKLRDIIPQSTSVYIQEALYTGNVSQLQEKLQKLLMQSVSYYDTMGENFYHGLTLGLCAVMDSSYRIVSNREAGDGRYDICMHPKKGNLPGIIIEFKAAKNASEDDLKKLSQKALRQIDDRHYASEFSDGDVSSVLKYGIAFSGKNVEIAAESDFHGTAERI